MKKYSTISTEVRLLINSEKIKVDSFSS